MRFSTIGKALLVGVGCAALIGAALPATAAAGGEGFQLTPPEQAEAVTLITGDRVTLHDGPDGPVVEFAPAQRESGAPVSYASYGDEEHYYVIPSDVAGLVPTQLDLSLFDVKALAEVASDDRLPVIVQSTEPTDAKADAAEWEALSVDPDRTLESIDAISGDVPAEGAPELIEAASEGTSVEKVWLDAPTEALDAISAPQIGAPAAWEAGLDGTGAVVAVLDTGIDTTHPDLDEGVVIGERDFTGSGTAKDAAGHGTHVASIVAGTGEASGGANRGVAYGAKLLNGRVLNAAGFGETSWIIDAMEWAAAEGADVINMSLGVRGEYTDGKDPGALAIDSLSQRYDTLVVVAAGNEGTRGATTVTTPGTADSALTVGAVDEWDQLAAFSSTGPRFGDAGVKPDVTAPGAWILAARAAGTRPDLPAGDMYLYDGGTSMAAPHVAGAAAILKAARPDLDGEALKALLMGTAQPTVGSIWREGAGKVIIPAAIAEPVYAEPASLSVGVFASPRSTQGPRTTTINYTNTSGTPFTLYLSTAASGSDGAPAAEGTVTLSSDVVTVPAQGAASVDVTVDPRVDDPGFYTGTVTAAGPGFAPVRTVMGWQVEQNLAHLHFEALQPDGTPVISASYATLYNLDDPSMIESVTLVQGKADVRLPLGRYAILGVLENSEPGAELISGATLFTRDIEVTEVGDQTVVIDATKALPVTVDTEKKAQVTNIEQVLKRTLPGWGWPVQQATSFSTIVTRPGLPQQLYVLAEGELAGEETLTENWLLGAPKLDVQAVSASTTLDLAEDLRYAVTSPELTGKVSATLVDAGTGTPAELQAAAVAGKIALVEARPEPVGRVMLLNAQAQAAKDAGAIAVIAYGAHDGPYWEDVDFRAMGEFPDKPLPTLTLSREKGLELLALASAKKGAKLSGTGYGYPPYDYAFAKVEHGIPASLSYTLDGSNTASVSSPVKAQNAGTSLQEWHMMVTDQSYIGFNRWLDEPIAERTIHYYADPAARYQHSAEAYAGGANPGEVFPTAFMGALRSYQPGETASETLLGQVVHGGLLPNPASPAQSSVRREGDTLMIDLPYRVDGDGNPNIYGPDGGTDSRFQLWVDDELYVTGEYANGSGEVPAEARTYRVLLDSDRYERWWTQSTEVSTEWSFTSSTTDALTVLPLLQLDYGVQGLDALNVTAGKRISLTPTVSHQDGSTGAAISGLKLWASYDGGRTWTTIAVTGSAGSYAASITPPKGTTKISLKSEAWDAAGSTFKETVLDAIALK